jgi:hypothetical protein
MINHGAGSLSASVTTQCGRWALPGGPPLEMTNYEDILLRPLCLLLGSVTCPLVHVASQPRARVIPPPGSGMACNETSFGIVEPLPTEQQQQVFLRRLNS